MSEMLAMLDAVTPKTPEQLQREEIQRQTLEAAAKQLEQQHVSHSYAAAFKKAARLLRGLKP